MTPIDRTELGRDIGRTIDGMIRNGRFTYEAFASEIAPLWGLKDATTDDRVKNIRYGFPLGTPAIGVTNPTRELRRLAIILAYLDVAPEHPVVAKIRSYDGRFVYTPREAYGARTPGGEAANPAFA